MVSAEYYSAQVIDHFEHPRNAGAMEAMKKADDPAKVPAAWAEPLAAFKKVRQKYLMYQ